MAIEQPPRLPGFDVHHNDRAFAGIGDKRDASARVDPHIVEITLVRRYMFIEWDCSDDLIWLQINFHELRSAPNDSLHFRRRRIEYPEIVLIIHNNTLHADEMGGGRTELVPLLVGKWFRFAIYDFCDGGGMLIRIVSRRHRP